VAILQRLLVPVTRFYPVGLVHSERARWKPLIVAMSELGMEEWTQKLAKCPREDYMGRSFPVLVTGARRFANSLLLTWRFLPSRHRSLIRPLPTP
jgi:hypothetical protein